MSLISRLLWPNVEIEMHALSVCSDTSWAWRRRWKPRGAMGSEHKAVGCGFKDLSGRRWIQTFCHIAILHLYFPQKVGTFDIQSEGIQWSFGFRMVHVTVDLAFQFCWSHCLDRSRHFALVGLCKVTSEGQTGMDGTWWNQVHVKIPS